MSTDYSAVCMTCRRYIHLGQRMAHNWSFGWGTPSTERLEQYIDDTRRQGEWIMHHVHSTYDGTEKIKGPCDVRIIVAECEPPGFTPENTDDVVLSET